MSYEKHNWTDNETITAAKMNNIEDGIEEMSGGGGGGYDAELSVYHENNSSADYEFTIISGSFADLADKISNNIVPHILLRLWDDLTGTRSCTSVVALYTANLEASVPYIIFSIKFPAANQTGTYNNEWVVRFQFFWNAEDEVYQD